MGFPKPAAEQQLSFSGRCQQCERGQGDICAGAAGINSHERIRPLRPSDQTKRTAVTLYGHGFSLRCVAKLLATSAHSVIRWVTEYVETRCSKPAPEGAVVIEVDEMWHYLGAKANKLWIWTAFDRATAA